MQQSPFRHHRCRVLCQFLFYRNQKGRVLVLQGALISSDLFGSENAIMFKRKSGQEHKDWINCSTFQIQSTSDRNFCFILSRASVKKDGSNNLLFEIPMMSADHTFLLKRGRKNRGLVEEADSKIILMSRFLVFHWPWELKNFSGFFRRKQPIFLATRLG